MNSTPPVPHRLRSVRERRPSRPGKVVIVMQWTVVYHDPRRAKGGSHTLHVRGCADVGWALRRDKSGLASTKDIDADSLEAALIQAQYQGLEPGEGSDLGDVEVAPCVSKGT